MDHVPTNTRSSQGESQLYIFEDNEAVIKMIIKGRSPTMGHVSRTHRVGLDWLFDRINLESKIQIKDVDTKIQLADSLTQGSFSRDEWDHFLCLFNIMCFSTYSGSHLKSSFSKPERLVLVPCRNEDKTQPRVVGLRWQKPDLPNFCCKVSAKRVARHKDLDLQSIR